MATTVKIRRSGTATATPSSLEHGEIAINYADGKVFWKDASNVITSFTFQSYALASHTHAASDITSGTLDSARLDATLAALAGVTTSSDQVIYATGSDTFATTALSSFARTLIDDADAATARSTLSVQPTASPAFTGAASFGNTIAVGATLSSWASNAGVVQTANYASLSAFNDPSLHLTLNAYYDGANWVYISSAAASNYYQLGGEHIWRGAASGTAGTNVSWTTRLTISSTGTATFAGQILADDIDTANSVAYGFDGDADTGVGRGGANVLTLVTNGTERVRVDASGNVGVGEQSPTQKMHVVGAVASFAGTTSYDQSCIQISYDSGVGTVTSSGAPGAIAFRTNITGNFTAERMRIAGDGAITMPEVYADTVGATNRDLYIDDTGKLGYVSSIRESKTDIVTLDDVLWLSALSPVSYRYRKQDADGNYTDEADGVTDYGLIAEDVEAVKPELCFYDQVDGEPQLRGVTYSKLITPMLRYIQQLEARIAALEERING
jgi:hypothetical protein